MTRPKLIKLLAVLFALSLVAAACGSDDDAEPAASGDAAAAADDGAAAEEEMADIVDTAVAAGDFGTLVAAVQAAGLEDTLRGEGPFTVFAPTDAAFAALPEGVVESLLADPETLGSILTYHVVSGKVLAADVVGLDSATTVNSADVTITVDGESVMVDSANVVVTDIETSNGVIHVIDAVMLPPDVQL